LKIFPVLVVLEGVSKLGESHGVLAGHKSFNLSFENVNSHSVKGQVVLESFESVEFSKID
jgi:hypothetical protein